jgi:hypothetical protein
MNATLKLNNSVLAYADLGITSNPLRRYVDWAIARSIPVSNPQSQPYALAPGDSITLVGPARSIGLDNGTPISITLSPLAPDRYRFGWVPSETTPPAFRTERSFSQTGSASVSIVANANSTITFTSPSNFASTNVGDVLYIPGVATGDTASVFGPLNEGFWTVIGIPSSDAVICARPAGTVFTGASTTATAIAGVDFFVYTAAGVQVDDFMVVPVNGFVAPVSGTYKVVAVTSRWVEVVSQKPLPLLSSTTNTGLAFYATAKRFVRIEGDQSFVVQLNGNNGLDNQVDPVQGGDPDNTGWFEKWGPVYQLEVLNLSTETLNLIAISAE